ncbi:MAG: acyltransferase family protein [Chloroflexi bacterium]|nr:acyltransferase family protein [Chloroflexota bacterium]
MKTKTISRLLFVDNWRLALVILMVVHHVAVIYGAGTPFYYLEPPWQDPLAYLTLLRFVLINQSWFMGAFFLISGYFIPQSFDRKGVSSFLKDRLLRLGIPLFIFIFILNPVASIGRYFMPVYLGGVTGPFTWQQYPGLIGPGVLWFVELLLIFDFGYAAWRKMTKNRTPQVEVSSEPPGYLAIGAFVLALALAGYLLRSVMPMGKATPVLGFPTPGYIPQYLSLFVLGAVAYRHNWFQTIRNSMGIVGFVTALGATILLFPIAMSDTLNWLGNGTWQSAVYSLWDSIVAIGMCLGLIALFRRFFNNQGKLASFLSQHSYSIFFIHAPVIVFLALALREINVEHLLKFGLASIIGVPLCFGVAYLVRRIPFASRIL